jgi:transposase
LLSAAAVIYPDMKQLGTALQACPQLMTIPGVGALAFTPAVDDPERFKRSRDLGG